MQNDGEELAKAALLEIVRSGRSESAIVKASEIILSYSRGKPLERHEVQATVEQVDGSYIPPESVPVDVLQWLVRVESPTALPPPPDVKATLIEGEIVDSES